MSGNDRLSGLVRCLVFWAGALLLAMPPGIAVGAADAAAPPPAPAAGAAPAAPTPAPAAKRATIIVEADGWAGGFFPEGAGRLEELRGGYAIGFAAEIWPDAHVGLGGEFGLRHGSASSRTALLPAGWDAKSDRMDLDTRWFGPTVRLAWPLGRIRPWVSTGALLQLSRIVLDGSLGGLRLETDRRSTDPALLAGVGVDAILSDGFVLSIQGRRVWGNASFADLAPPRAEIGGFEASVRLGIVVWR